MRLSELTYGKQANRSVCGFNIYYGTNPYCEEKKSSSHNRVQRI